MFMVELCLKKIKKTNKRKTKQKTDFSVEKLLVYSLFILHDTIVQDAQVLCLLIGFMILFGVLYILYL